MRTLVVVALVILLMVVGGWLAFSYSGGSARVEFKTDAVKRDVDKAVKGTEEFIKGIGNEQPSTSP
jgi:hypothetical protein